MKSVGPGLGLCLGLAGLAIFFSKVPWVEQTLRFGPLLIVILLGMVVASAVSLPSSLLDGVKFCQKPVLRFGVGLLGIRLALAEIWKIGLPSVVVVVVATLASMVFGVWLARRMKVDEGMGLLLSTGTAICGASAIVAADTVVRAKGKDAAVSLGVITLWGTVGIFVYPWLPGLLGWNHQAYGLFAGATLQEVAQVVAAGSAVGLDAQNFATVVKLERVMLLVPILIGLAAMLSRGSESREKTPLVPWFLVMFVVLSGVRTLAESGGYGPWIKACIEPVVTWVLCLGMAGVGLQTGFRDVRSAGWKPVALGFFQWLFLCAVTFALISVIPLR